jgi:peptidoglycan L-alanyl-D-glutamate endopeptidase CwlK
MTSVTTICCDLSELTAVAQTACRLLFQECYKAGINFIFITETYRSQARQNYLYERKVGQDQVK